MNIEIKKEFIGIRIKRPCKNHRNEGKRYKACGSKLRKAFGTTSGNTDTGAGEQAHKQAYQECLL